MFGWTRPLLLSLVPAVAFMLGGCAGGGDTGLSAPVITSQPADASVLSGQTASYAVVASASPAPTYQWRRNGIEIAGATSATYVTPALALADGGAVYTVVVRNSQGSATSNGANLGVGAVSTAEKRSLFSVLILTAELYLAGIAPFEFVQNDAFVEPTTVCQTGVGSPMLNGVPAVVGQALPDTATVSATFSTCTEVDGTSFSGSSSVVYDFPSLDLLNGTATANVSNLRVTTRSAGVVDNDYTANGVGAIAVASASTPAEDTVTILLTPAAGSTLRNELDGLTATFASGAMTLTAGVSATSVARIRFDYDHLSTSISGVSYVANGFHELSRDAQGGVIAGSGEVIFTTNGVEVGRIYATNGGVFVEVDGVSQPMKVPATGLSRR